MPDSKCMVEKAGKEKCKLEATGIGVVEGSSVAKSKDRARKCNACPKRNTKIKKLEKGGPILGTFNLHVSISMYKYYKSYKSNI